MRKLKFFLAAALILCAVCLIAHGVEWVNDTPVNPDGPINVPLDGARFIPMAEDTAHCDDGTGCQILGIGGYPDCGPLPSMPQEWSRSDCRKEAGHK